MVWSLRGNVDVHGRGDCHNEPIGSSWCEPTAIQRGSVSIGCSWIEREVSYMVRVENTLCGAAVCGKCEDWEAWGDGDGGYDDGSDYCLGLAIGFGVRICGSSEIIIGPAHGWLRIMRGR